MLRPALEHGTLPRAPHAVRTLMTEVSGAASASVASRSPVVVWRATRAQTDLGAGLLGRVGGVVRDRVESAGPPL